MRVPLRPPPIRPLDLPPPPPPPHRQMNSTITSSNTDVS